MYYNNPPRILGSTAQHKKCNIITKYNNTDRLTTALSTSSMLIINGVNLKTTMANISFTKENINNYLGLKE